MLKTSLPHPEILAALAASGHFSQVLIADGNFPVAGNRGPNARIVHLKPGDNPLNRCGAGRMIHLAVTGRSPSFVRNAFMMSRDLSFHSGSCD